MKLASIIIRLEAWLQEELAGQERLEALLSRQEAAIRSSDDEALAEAGKAVDAELAGQPRRTTKRSLLLAELANALGVAPSSLTLSDIADRADAAGIDTTRLRRMREKVRDKTAAVLKRGRRVAALARYHQSLLSELMGILFDPDGSAGPGGARGSGSIGERPHLIDAEA